MKDTINSINSHVRSWEPVDLSIRVDEAVMRATPLSNGKWHIVFKQGENIKGACSATSRELEKIAETVLSECDDRKFHEVTERDKLGYCVEQSYTAEETVKKRRKRKRDVFKNIAFV